MSSKDSGCPDCGTVAAGPVVPGRVTTGTVVRLGPVRQEPVVPTWNLVLARCGPLITAIGLVAVALAGGARPLLRALLVVAALLIVLAALGAVLRLALPREQRSSRPRKALWPLTLPMRDAVLGRTVEVLPLTVKDVAGTEFHCVLTGHPVPRIPATGEMVQVFGRRTRAGTVAVRRLVTAGTGRAITPRYGASGNVVRVISAAIAAVWILAALSTVWLLVSG